ncbi:MAG: DUF4091 domain-containing protein [Bryobacteraceae bacterium]|nr:DUF4091 domain-containing protein [Bryobacteraceae bacterium]
MDVIFHYRQESSKVGFPFGIGLLIAGILASVMGGMDATESTLIPRFNDRIVAERGVFPIADSAGSDRWKTNRGKDRYPMKFSSGATGAARNRITTALFFMILATCQPVDAAPVVWTTSSLVRVPQTGPAGTQRNVLIQAARNEWESFQIVVQASGEALSNVNVTVSDLRDAAGNIIPSASMQLYREHYVYVSQASPDWRGTNRPLGVGWYPDALIPFRKRGSTTDLSGAALDAVPFNLNAGRNQPIWVDVYVPANAPPGNYKGTYVVSSSQGAVSGNIDLTVWDFTLPTTPSAHSSFLYWTAGSAEANAELLHHRLYPARTATAEQAALKSQLGLGAVNLGFWSGADIGNCSMSASPSASQFQTAKNAQAPGLMVYNYTADEVGACANLHETIKSWSRNMHQAGIKNLITMPPTPALYDDGAGKPGVDIWVILPVQHDANRVKEVLDLKHEVWSYNTLVQDAYSPKWLIDFDPINFRIQGGFMNQSLGLTGLLYWRIDRWSSDPWNNVNNTGTFSSSNYPGEGMLVYPGQQVGVTGVVPSMRLKWLRDSIDDFEYLELLKKAGKESEAMSAARSVASDFLNWTRDAQTLESVRRQLGEELASTPGSPAREPLPAPGNPAPATGATGVSLAPTLTWGSVSGATSYEVHFGTQNPPALVTTSSGTTYVPGSLSAGTVYYWKVVARNGDGQTSSPVWSFATLAAPAPPQLRSPGNGSSLAANSTILDWQAASGATSYDVYLGTQNPPPFLRNQTTLQYSTGILSNGVTYFWRVVAKNAAGSTMSPVWSFQAPAPLPGVPALVSPGNGTTLSSLTSAVLQWGAASNATDYEVYAGVQSPPPLLTTVSAQSYNLTNLAPGSLIYWRVVARNTSGATSSQQWSFRMGAAAATPATGTPIAVSVTPASGTGWQPAFTASFSDADGATDFATVGMLINSSVSGAGSCWVVYETASNSIWLAQDSGTSWKSVYFVGTSRASSRTLSNSQCSVNISGVQVLRSGTTLSLTVPLDFKTGFTGLKNVYLIGQDRAGKSTGYQPKGTWIVP